MLCRMETPTATDIGWAAYGLWRWLDERDQDQPLRLDEMCTNRERRDGVRTLIERLENADLLRRERAVTDFATGAAWLYRTR